jgi:hypothetical protein
MHLQQLSYAFHRQEKPFFPHVRMKQSMACSDYSILINIEKSHRGETPNGMCLHSWAMAEPPPLSDEVKALIEEQGIDFETSGLKYLSNDARVRLSTALECTFAMRSSLKAAPQAWCPRLALWQHASLKASPMQRTWHGFQHAISTCKRALKRWNPCTRASLNAPPCWCAQLRVLDSTKKPNKVEKIKAKKGGHRMWTEVSELGELIRAGKTRWEDLDLDDVDVRLKWSGLFHRKKRTPGRFMMRLKVRGLPVQRPSGLCAKAKGWQSNKLFHDRSGSCTCVLCLSGSSGQGSASICFKFNPRGFTVRVLWLPCREHAA